MDMEFTASQQAFREEVRAFLTAHLPERLRDGAAPRRRYSRSPTSAASGKRILYDQGWLAYNWPAEFGGTGWSPVQRYLFEKECALADAPGLPVLGLKLLGPVVYTFGTPAQQQPLPAADPHRRRLLVPGVLRAGCRLRSREPAHACSPRGRSLRRQRQQDLDDARAFRRSHVLSRAHRPECEGAARHQFPARRHATAGRHACGRSAASRGDHEVNEVFLDNVEVPVADLVGEEGQRLERSRSSCSRTNAAARASRRSCSRIIATLASAPRAPKRTARRTLAKDQRFAAQLATTRTRCAGARSHGAAHPGATRRRSEARPADVARQARRVATCAQEVDALAMKAFGYAGLQLADARPLYGHDRARTRTLQGRAGRGAPLSQQPRVVDLRRQQRGAAHHHRQDGAAPLTTNPVRKPADDGRIDSGASHATQPR